MLKEAVEDVLDDPSTIYGTYLQAAKTLQRNIYYITEMTYIEYKKEQEKSSRSFAKHLYHEYKDWALMKLRIIQYVQARTVFKNIVNGKDNDGNLLYFISAADEAQTIKIKNLVHNILSFKKDLDYDTNQATQDSETFEKSNDDLYDIYNKAINSLNQN